MSDGVVNFHADATSGNAPLTVHFTDDTQGYKTGWTYQWNFGDGQSTAKDPSHTYNSPGTYAVSLTVYNGSGAVGSEVKQGYIVVNPSQPSAPVANFLMTPSTGNAPLAVKFTSLASGGTLSIDWDFGDNTQHSAEVIATHVYTAPGNYTVTLKASNPGGTGVKTANIVVLPPLPSNSTGNTSSISTNNSSVVGAAATITPTAASAISSDKPQSSGFTFSVTEDLLQIVLTALIAIVIAAMVIYYFSSLGKRGDEKKPVNKTPGRSMLKSRMPKIEQTAAPVKVKKPAESPVKPPEPELPPEVALKPAEAIKTHDVDNIRDIARVVEAVRSAEAAAKVPEPAPKAPEAVKPPVAAPVMPPAPPAAPAPATKAPAPAAVKPAPKPAAVKPTEAKKPPVKLSELLKVKAKDDDGKAPPGPKAKPSKKRNDVDKDYIYGLVLGENQDLEGKDGANKK